jgi:hypothetical protein
MLIEFLMLQLVDQLITQYFDGWNNESPPRMSNKSEDSWSSVRREEILQVTYFLLSRAIDLFWPSEVKSGGFQGAGILKPVSKFRDWSKQ